MKYKIRPPRAIQEVDICSTRLRKAQKWAVLGLLGLTSAIMGAFLSREIVAARVAISIEQSFVAFAGTHLWSIQS